MADAERRRAVRTRWRRTILRHLEDLPRQFAALESAMASFGEDLDAKRYRDWIAPYLGAGSAIEL